MGHWLGFRTRCNLIRRKSQTYTAGVGRCLFQCGELTFGVVICHEGWRYPETVRWAARNRAHVVFHPHVEVVDDAQYLPSQFADPSNTFHEKAALCRAAENTCYFATVNCVSKVPRRRQPLSIPTESFLRISLMGKKAFCSGRSIRKKRPVCWQSVLSLNVLNECSVAFDCWYFPSRNAHPTARSLSSIEMKRGR